VVNDNIIKENRGSDYVFPIIIPCLIEETASQDL
jgi:hypothetical protein